MKTDSRIQGGSSEYIRVVKVKGVNGEEKTLKFPMKLDLERPKRPRTTFNEDQLKALEEMYQMSSYLTGEARATLAAKLGLTDTQVKVWLQNRRTKSRRVKETTKPASNKESCQENNPSPSLPQQSSYTGQTTFFPQLFLPTPYSVNFLVSSGDPACFGSFGNSMFATK